jgi:hypothetical protein
MTKDEILLASQDYLFPAVFHYYKEPLRRGWPRVPGFFRRHPDYQRGPLQR